MKPDRQQFVDDDRPRCPDDGFCHHECNAYGRPCFRVAFCAPLTNMYPDDRWPETELWKAEWEQISNTAAELQRDRDRLLGTIETTRSTLVRFRLWVDLFVDKPDRLSEQISHLIKRIDGTLQPHEQHSDASLSGGVCDVCDRKIEDAVNDKRWQVTTSMVDAAMEAAMKTPGPFTVGRDAMRRVLIAAMEVRG